MTFIRMRVCGARAARAAILAVGLVAASARAESPSDAAAALFGGQEQTTETGQRISVVEFPDADITDILKIVSDNSGWSIFASKSAKVKVSISIKNITARELLDRAVAAAGLVYRKDKNVINVMSFDEYAEAFGLAKQIVPLRYASAGDAAQIITPFLTKSGKVSVQETGNRLVLLDTQAALTEIARVLTALDVPSSVAQVEVVKLIYRDAGDLVAQISQYAGSSVTTNSRQTATPPGSRQAGTSPRQGDGIPRIVSGPVAAFADVQTNSILLIGSPEDRKVIKETIASLDTREMRTIRTYPVRNIDAQEIFDALEKVYTPSSGQRTGSADERVRRVAIGKQTNAITVFGTAADQAQAESLVQSMDIPIPEGPGRVRVYALENAKAEDVATLLAGLTGGENTTASNQNGRSRLGSAEVTGITSVDRPASWQNGPSQGGAQPNPAAGAASSGPPASQPAGLGTALQQKPRIAANADTNSVVVWATPSDQQAIEQIVRQLDRRRPQVLIEAILVELTGDDNLNIGVELESWQQHTSGDTASLFFTSFGLSTIDPNTGKRVLIAQPGMSTAILRPDQVPFVINALELSGKANIMSYPKVLVNDNVPGTISSIHEEPYTQVNASNTVATTSFGGYIQAGIQFGVVPHISENNYLRLEYQVQLNSFVGSPTTTTSGTLPPARDTNTIQSEVTVPDNHTIIIGGLRRQLQSTTAQKVPLLGDIPWAGLFFQNQNKTGHTVTLYFFLRPQILRDDRFLDLKLISQQEADRADIAGQWPRNPAIAISNTETYQSWQTDTCSAGSAPASQPAE